jgi:hypothetical protein
MDLIVSDKDTFGDIEFERYKIDKYYKGSHLNFDFYFKVRNTNINHDYDDLKAILFYQDVYDVGSSGRIVPDNYVLYSWGINGPLSTIEEWAQKLNISKEMVEQLLKKLYSNCYKHIYDWYKADDNDDINDIKDYKVVLEDEDEEEDNAWYIYRVYGKDNISRKIEIFYSITEYSTRYTFESDYYHVSTEFYIDDKEVDEYTFVKSLNVNYEEFEDLVRELESENEGHDSYYDEPD